MSTLSHSPAALSDCLDIVDTAVIALGRRLPAAISREDLASVGKLALIAALKQCEGPLEEVRSYCFVRVRGAMLDELRRLDPVSRRLRDLMKSVVRAQAQLSGRLGRAVTRAEIAVATQLSLAEVSAAQAALAQEAEFIDFEWDAIPDPSAPSPAETTETEDLRVSLRGALERLATNQACVLYRYYFDEATLEDIAGELGVSKERVRQIREAGEKKLRADFLVLALWQSLITATK